MLKQSDVQGRLRLFRYGIIVVTVTAFLASLLSPYMMTMALPVSMSIMDSIVPALIVTVITAVIGVVAYFAYAQVLKRTVGEGNS